MTIILADEALLSNCCGVHGKTIGVNALSFEDAGLCAKCGEPCEYVLPDLEEKENE